MKTYLRAVLKRHLFLLVACFLILGNGFSAESTAWGAVNGSVRQIGNQQVLSLWGSYYEMGYAHGYLMADKIRDLVDTYVIGVLASGSTVAEKVADYNTHLTLIPLYHTFYPESLDEISGMVAGMIASGKSLYVPSLGRNIDDRDIKAFNLFIEYFFGCSSLGAWGTATANGETLMARNYDFFYDLQGNILKDQLIITYEPVGKPKFVSFGWPGWFGLISGMNEYGITLMVNGGNVDNSSTVGPFHPAIEVYRYILENTTRDNFPAKPLSIVNSVSEFTPLIVQIGSPNLYTGDPVYYIEDSNEQNLIREAAYTDPTYNHIMATNHFIKIIPPPVSGESVTRYNTLRNGLIGFYGSGDRKVDSYEVWSLMDAVADIVAPTLTTVVMRPDRMEFDVSFATLVNGVFTSAVHIVPQTYSWATLFPTESLPDLIVQSVTPVPAAPAVGQAVNVTVTVKNQGNAAAGSFAMDFYKNLTTSPLPLQAGDGYCSKSGLAAGATDSCTFVVSYPAAGAYNMWAQVDSAQQVTELSESNNVFGPQSITVGSTATPVVVSITAPAAGSTVSGTVNVAATATSSTRISKVEFYVNGSLKRTDTRAPYTYTWYTTTIANGVYSLTAKAYDAAGNTGQSAAVAVTVSNGIADTTAPVTAITAPAANATVSGTTSITASATDNVGVSRVEFYVSGVLKGTDTSAPYAYSWNTTSTANGSYSLTSRAYDAAGNVGQSAAVSVTVSNALADTIAPTVAITSPVANSTVSGTVCAAVSASDNVAVTKVEYYVNGWLDRTVTVSPFGFCVTTTAEFNGTHTMYAKAYDAAGNAGQSATISYTIRN